MSKMLRKNTLRDIGRTKARFISIALIILLGVGFLVGIHSTAPSMYASAKSYYDESNLMDFRLISTVGFSKEDIDELGKIEGVSSVMPSYFSDVRQTGESGNIIRLIAKPVSYKGQEINTPSVREGRLPQNANEIALGYRDGLKEKLGDTISFTAPKASDDIGDTLVNAEYTVVGFVDSPLYISFERGYTNVGSGSIHNYAIINGNNFKSERFTEVYVTFDALKNYSPYSEEYKNALKKYEEKLEDFGAERVDVFIRDNIQATTSSLDEAEATLGAERAQAVKEITEAQGKIDDGKSELEDNREATEKELQDAKDKIEAVEAELRENKLVFESMILEAQEKLLNAQAEITEGEQSLSKAKETLMDEVYENLSAFGVTEEMFESFIGEDGMISTEDVEKVVSMAKAYTVILDTQITSAQNAVAAIESKAEAEGKNPTGYPEYNVAVSTLTNLTQAKNSLQEFLDEGKDELVSAVEELETAEDTLAQAKADLLTEKEEYELQKTLGEEKLLKAEEALSLAKAQYEQASSEFEDFVASAQQELSDGQDELTKKALKGYGELYSAQEEIDNGRVTLSKVPTPMWYCNDRDDNPGYSSYKDNVERVNSVGKVFPVFFMIVAVLVCVTTMSRLVEEQRGDIGALTTLGYKPSSIVMKYVSYSMSATVVGSLVGIIVGVLVIPVVIFEAYGILYKMPQFVLTLNVQSSVIAVLVALICTCCVSVFTCFSLIKHKPATLLRPKAPKPGKRIMLEKIGFLWKRMGFFTKVTARNIFRYKARFLMTVIGVAGCTALIFSGFGLYHSITDIVDKQFGEIFSYDVSIVAKGSKENVEDLREYIENDIRIDCYSLSCQNLIEVSFEDKKMSENTYISVAENTEDFKKLINLKDRKTQEPIDLEKGACVLTEKLAKSLSATVGDMINITDGERVAELPVSGICENYLNGYVYMDTETYEEAFSVKPSYGIFSCKFKEGVTVDDNSFSQEYINKGNTLAVNLTSTGVASFSDMISALNYVVIVMIASAAALAFVVLYNLTNINIAERKREISTLKVLGFKNSETAAYIYRENIVLSVVGIAAGLLLGVWLLNFIINTVEISMVMFGRELHLSSFLIATVLTLFFSITVNWVMRIRLKKIDMVESLKSVE